MSYSFPGSEDGSSKIDPASYYSAKTEQAYDQNADAGNNDGVNMPCGNNCPAVTINRTKQKAMYPVGKGWLFTTSCFDSIRGLNGGGTCVNGWPHSSSSGSCGGNDTFSCGDGNDRSCAITYGYNGSDAGGNCCKSSSAGCKYKRAKAQGDSPSVCSDSSQFQAGPTGQAVFSSASFYNGSDLGFGEAVIMVTPNYQDSVTKSGNLSQTTTINSSAYPNVNDNNYFKDSFITGQGTNGRDRIQYWEQDKKFQCLSTKAVADGENTAPYAYGSDNGCNGPVVGSGANGLSVKDTVAFTNCRLPQQITKCCSKGTSCCNLIGTSATYSGGDCCAVGSVGCTCTNMTVQPDKNNAAVVYRPYNVYYNVMVGSGGSKTVYCDAAGDNESSCLLFNGAVKGVPLNVKQDWSGAGDNAYWGKSLFEYEPNPFRAPCDHSTDKTTGSKGPRLGIRVVYSLLRSADGTDPSTGSYLSQFVKDTACGSSSAAPYQSQCGFQGIGNFWTRLQAMLGCTSTADKAMYTAWTRMYYVYIVANRFFLSLYQLAPCFSLDAETSMPIALFADQGEWTSIILAANVELAAVSGNNDVTELLTDAMAAAAFTSSKPAVKAITTSNTVSVTITVPPLLFSWMDDDNGLGDLLLRMFPTTNDEFNLGTTFDSSKVYGIVNGGKPSTPQTIFQVVAGSSTKTYYTVSTSSAVPAATTTAPTANSSTQAAVACSVTFTLQVAKESLTLLFYLYYLSQNSNNAITSVTDFLAAGEPAVTQMPKEVDYGTACSLLESKACDNTAGYKGVSSYRVNNLFLNAESQVCKCLLLTNMPATYKPGTKSGLSNEALCFNGNCTTTNNVSINLQSILQGNAANKGVCPAGAAAKATVVSGVITKILVTNGGGGYQQLPTVNIVGDGTGADAVAVVENGVVTGVTVARGGTKYTYADVSFVPNTTKSGAEDGDNSKLCKPYCNSYMKTLQSGSVDVQNVNLNTLVQTCDVNILDIVAGVPPSTEYIASAALAFSAMPVLYIVVLIVSLIRWKKGAGKPFNSTLAANPAFFVPVVAVFALLIAGIVYYWFDLQGFQSCRTYSTPDAKGYTYPSSACYSNGFLGLPNYALPQDFCFAERSYCECSGLSMPCSRTSCGCDDTDCCSVEGICTQPALRDTPLTGRPLQIKTSEMRITFMTTLFCVCIALVAVPAVVAGVVYGTSSAVKSPLALLGIGLAAFVVTAAAAAIPAAIQALDPKLYNKMAVGVGECSSLSQYPDTLTLLSDTKVIYTRVTSGSTPQYKRASNSKTGCSCCGSSMTSAACGTACKDDGCTCTWDSGASKCYSSPPPLISYDADQKAWKLSDPSDSSYPALYNVEGSGVIYQAASKDDATNEPTLYTTFQDSSKNILWTFVFCGSAGDQSSCVQCACSNTAAASKSS